MVQASTTKLCDTIWVRISANWASGCRLKSRLSGNLMQVDCSKPGLVRVSDIQCTVERLNPDDQKPENTEICTTKISDFRQKLSPGCLKCLKIGR